MNKDYLLFIFIIYLRLMQLSCMLTAADFLVTNTQLLHSLSHFFFALELNVYTCA
jgi:hypothetical protein